MARIDLNADLGEGFGVWRLGDDDAMLGIVTSANVACGFHAGDPAGLLSVCRLAAERGVRIGAQVSYRDLAGFGRRFIDVDAEDLLADVVYQIGALHGLAQAAGSAVSYVKPHGALYNTIVTNREQAAAVAEAVRTVDARTAGAGPGAARCSSTKRGSVGCARCPRRSPIAPIGRTASWCRGANPARC